MTTTPQPDSRDGERKCPRCNGDGSYFLVPEGRNPFHMSLPTLARVMVKHVCHTCGGTGKAKGEGDA